MIVRNHNHMNAMNPRQSSLPHLRERLQGKQLHPQEAQSIHGGGRPAIVYLPLATPYILDTDRP